MDSFNDKQCLVTGAASGIGLAVSQALKQAGARVIMADIDDNGVNLAQELGATFVKLDVTDPQAWAQFAQEAPNLDYLHLNAGIQIAPPDAPLEDYQFQNMDLTRYRRMMGVNVDGVVFGLHSYLPKMNSGGAIVVTSSLAGITPYEVDPLYSMSKHAVSGLVRSLASTCAQANLRINAICPGGIDTNIIPHEQRVKAAVFMTPACLADEVLKLFTTIENGKTWAKVAENKPAWIIRAPGDKASSSG